jgi:hypothetical protein
MRDGLLLAWTLFAWGAQALVPWHLAGRFGGRFFEDNPERRRPWALALLPLLATGFLAALAFAGAHPDAALVKGVYPPAASRTARLLPVLLCALALADLAAAFGWRRIEPMAWRIVAGFGLAFLLAASWAGELIRVGEGPESPAATLAVLTLLRLLLALAAAEALASGRPLFAPFAGPGLALYFLLLPSALARALEGRSALYPLSAAAALLLAARWLPASLRRPALAAGVLLAGLFLAQATVVSQGLGEALPPMPSLPVP